jgi:hypothetical protein
MRSFSSLRGAQSTNYAGRSHLSDAMRIFLGSLFDARLKKL